MEKYAIQVVFVTGDITDSSMPFQWKEAKAILDELDVPYVPTLGNHDVWTYNNSKDSNYETPTAQGDYLFASTFQDILTNGPKDLNFTQFAYNSKPTHNPNQNINSWYQNWKIIYNQILFYSLDWNTREAAIPGDKGALPTAELQDFPGGTFDFLTSEVTNFTNSDGVKNIIFLQHHPFAMPFFVPEFIYSFSQEKKDKVFDLIQTNSDFQQLFWGTIAGHLHTWSPRNQTTELSKNEWLTEASKVASSFSLFSVENNRISSAIQKFYGFDY